MVPRPGPWFLRDVRTLLRAREQELKRHAHLGYKVRNGIGLTWIVPWPEGAQLQAQQLDIWFVEVCRRVRLQERDGVLSGKRGTSKATRINAKHLNGVVGDPWAPVHKTEGKSFTLGDGDLGYRTLARLLLGEKDSQDWLLPILAQPTPDEHDEPALAVVAAAIARGNSKTEGFRSRVLPIGGKQAYALSLTRKRQELFQLAQEQLAEIVTFDTAIRYGLAIAAAGGDREKVDKPQYERAREARTRFNDAVDPIFFEHLWLRHEAQEAGKEPLATAKEAFAREVFARATAIFEAELPCIPCQSILRPRAEARARTAYFGTVRRSFPELLGQSTQEEVDDVPA